MARTPEEIRQLNRQELCWLLEGLTIDSKKRIKESDKNS